VTSSDQLRPLRAREIFAFGLITVGLPTLVGFCLFNPPSIGFGVLEATSIIVSFFLVYLLLGVAIFLTRRINAVQSAIFTVLSLSFLITLLLAFAFVYRKLGLVSSNRHRTTDPIVCLYFSIITWTTVGYGDFTPSPEARLFAAGEALLAYIFMAVLIAGFLHLLARFRPERKQTAASR
jgi:ion channel